MDAAFFLLRVCKLGMLLFFFFSFSFLYLWLALMMCDNGLFDHMVNESMVDGMYLFVYFFGQRVGFYLMLHDGFLFLFLVNYYFWEQLEMSKVCWFFHDHKLSAALSVFFFFFLFSVDLILNFEFIDAVLSPISANGNRVFFSW